MFQLWMESIEEPAPADEDFEFPLQLDQYYLSKK